MLVKHNTSKAIKNGDSVEITLPIEKSGIYILVFVVNQCGANKITISNAYWKVKGDSLPQNYPTLSIPISPEWNTPNTAAVLSALSKGEHRYIFYNFSGITTDSTYDSTVSVYAVKL